MTDPDDRELEQYLSGKSRISRLYREAGGETPPPELDQKVLKHARDAVHRKRDRWLATLALAATVVLGVNVAWNVFEPMPPKDEAPPSRVFYGAVEKEKADVPADPRPETRELADRERPARKEARERKAEMLARRSPEDDRDAQTFEEKAYALDEAPAGRASGKASDEAPVGFAAPTAPAALAEPEAPGESDGAEKAARLNSERQEGPLPAGWYLVGASHWYDGAIDESVVHSPPDSLAMWRTDSGKEACGRLETETPAEPFRGARVEVSAFMKAEGVTGRAMLYASIGYGDERTAFTVDHLTHDETAWKRRKLAVDVPQYADRVIYGALLCGPGSLWIDDAAVVETR